MMRYNKTKKKLSLLLCLCLVLSLVSGCGGANTEVTSAVSVSERISATEEAAYPTEWTKTELENEDMGHVTARAEAFDGYDSVSIQNGTLIGRKTEDGRLTVSELGVDGSVLRSASIPVEESVNWNISRVLFGTDSVWGIEAHHTVLDEDTGETAVDQALKKWDFSGNVLLKIPLDNSFPWGENEMEIPFPQLQMMDSHGRILIKTEQYLYALDQDGTVVDTLDFMGQHYDLGRDEVGNIYLTDGMDAKQAYLLDQDTLEVGEALFPVKRDQTVVPGGGDFELYLIESQKLVGVDMDTGTLTTLVKWAEFGLVGAVNGLAFVDEDTLLLDTTDITVGSNQILTLRQMPVSEIPQKETVRVAYIFNELDKAELVTYSSFIQHAMNKFNRESDQYQVEFAYYTGTTALQMEVLAGNSPDIILFDTYGEEYPSEQIFSRSGALVDLEELIEADPELSIEDFLPNVITAMKDSNGGLYTMPLNFYFRTMTANRAYVEERNSWTTSDIYAAAKTMPEDMVVLYTPEATLEHFLQHSIDRYVDLENLTCDFANQSFYDLLTMCRDYSLPDIMSRAETLITVVSTMGTLSNFAGELRNFDDDTVFPGYPGAPGNGGDLVMMECMGILATAQQPEGAWEFLRTLYLPEIQRFASGLSLSIRKDVFHADNRKFMDTHGVTEEEIAAAEELVLGACSRTVYDNPAEDIVLEEAQAFFAGDKTAQQVAEIIENRVKIYLWEQLG